MPPTVVPKRRHPIEPIGYDELMSNAGMSGFVSFLIPSPLPETTPSVGPPPVEAPKRKGRVREAKAVEDGHSLAEHAIYEALWQAALPLDGDGGTYDGAPHDGTGDRTIRIGYHRLAQLTRLSWVSVKSNLRSLEKKLAIDVTGSENSATREGKSYRVYSRTAILERRAKAGLLWVRRSRGVELLTQPE
jgi:hypothetical protein